MELSYIAGDNTLLFLHDRLICRNGRGRLLRRLSSDETAALLILGKQLLLREICDQPRTLPGSDIRLEVADLPGVGRFVYVMFPDNEGGLNTTIVSRAELDEIARGLMENIGTREYHIRNSRLLWDDKQQTIVRRAG